MEVSLFTRYLKVIAQDSTGQGHADTVLYRFIENEHLQREATATELRRLKVFGKTYLKCAWFNAGEGEERYLRIFSQNLSGDGTPEIVHLHFREGPVIVYKAAAQDLDNDGGLELILASDVDNDGRSDRTDRSRVTALVKQFLKVGW
ncbi:hypothetical protein [Pseudomonas nunensis]|uniref:Uncharacterized protein n=1 Tax=Pseudomonas nunensis TaxID=2961896 RepID=A0ABY5EEK1_9PSED|nr:hypothetical protein [Pseudomonas nunensis]KOY04210.1 hypothetical protein AM274_02335 [Pseudomonas nunensis]KPN88134.1 hypothetical protein AL066_28285 [Pseudomonas nunensis]MCL5224583.1 hypothetical protein [Pseudomonas nunensis]UTO14196.1 hypothetical protein NK667_29265 [Pseudomonas nunensis]